MIYRGESPKNYTCESLRLLLRYDTVQYRTYFTYLLMAVLDAEVIVIGYLDLSPFLNLEEILFSF